MLGWAFGGLLAAGVAYIIGKICLGLRTDYLAIATIGISEIIRALLKNMDWLTRGTLTVSPIPWPTPLPQDLQAAGRLDRQTRSSIARLGFFAVVVAIVAVVLLPRPARLWRPVGPDDAGDPRQLHRRRLDGQERHRAASSRSSSSARC